jgi:hypothetical protein
MARAVRGEPAAAAEVDRVLRDAGEPRPVTLDAIAGEANDVLWNGSAGAGGFSVDRGGLVFDVVGIDSDLHRFLHLLERGLSGAGSDSAAALLAALDLVRGAFFPDLDDPVVRSAREDLAGGVRSAADVLGPERLFDPLNYVDRLEGPGRIADLTGVMIPALRARGWSRVARALARGSGPSGGV